MDVDQTNESVVVGEKVVVKWTVRPATGPEPAPDRLAALVAAGFTGMPRPWGLLRWRAPDGEAAAPVLVATVVAYLPDARDGWDWAVEDVRAVARGDLSLADAVAPWLQIGDLVARTAPGPAGARSRRATRSPAGGGRAPWPSSTRR